MNSFAFLFIHAHLVFFPPSFHRSLLWDLPGIGTLRHPAKTYYADKFLAAFDVVIIVFSQTVSETVLDLAGLAHTNGQAFFLVRTKVDEALRSMMRDRPEMRTQAKRVPDLKSGIVREVEKQWRQWRETGMTDVPDPEVYLFSSSDYEMWRCGDPRAAARGEADKFKIRDSMREHEGWHGLHDEEPDDELHEVPKKPCLERGGPPLEAGEWAELHKPVFDEDKVYNRIHEALQARNLAFVASP